MDKTTVYLPRQLRAALKRAAAAGGSSEAEFIRAAIERATAAATAPRPQLPLFRSRGVPRLAEQVDEALAGVSGMNGSGFGDR